MNKTLLALALAAAWGSAQAAAVTDGSMGAVQSLSGHFTVPQALGTLRGSNLFHSFGTFSIGSNESATFLSNAGVNNVIARVTGSEASLLQGSLALKAAGGARPDFFLINPNGITVTGGAAFDVPAGLHLSTAPQLRFADGSVWATGSTHPSTLSVAAPDSFGFLPGQTAAALRWRDAGVQLQPGHTLQLAGGSVAIDNALLLAPAGTIQLQATGGVQLDNGALLAATAHTADGVGRIAVDAGSLTIVGAEGKRTGVISQTGPDAQGGGISVKLSGALTMAQGAEITNAGASSVFNGATTIEAASARLSSDGQFSSIFSNSFGTAAGPGIALLLSGALEMVGADISSTSSGGSGAAGSLLISTGSMRLDGLGGVGLWGINSSGNSGAPGAIFVTNGGELSLFNGAYIGSSNRSGTAAAPVLVLSKSATLDGQGAPASVYSQTTGNGAAADVAMVVDQQLRLLNGGQVSSGTLGAGKAGDVSVEAASLSLRGQGGSFVTGVYSSSLSAESGRGGTVTVDAGQVSVTGDANISTSTFGRSGAGAILLRADSLSIDGQTAAGGIQSFAYGPAGDAGTVVVDVKNQLTLRDGGAIVAGTLGVGAAGSISVQAGSLLIDGTQATQTYTGIGGDALSSGAGASVKVDVRQLDIRLGGSISSGTFSATNAGSIDIVADLISIDGGGQARVATGIGANSGSAGNAGSVTIRARELQIVNEGGISSSALGSGRGGAIRIDAQTVHLATGGSVFSVTGDRGNAGLIDLRVGGALTVVDGGIVSASSGGAGAAGRINIEAGSVTITGSDASSGQRSRVASRALAQSAGDSGNIVIVADGDITLGPDALLSIANDARVADGAVFAPSFIRVQAGGNLISQGAEITAASSLNADAGAIALAAGGRVRLTDTVVRTSAHNGNGGPIGISAGDVVTLRNTAVTTSVDGVQGGDGGNIRIAGSALVLQSGFVQANTVAAKASGGNVTIDVPLLVPDGSNVFIGGNRIAQFRADAPGFNVIQAAAPNGLAGTLDVTRPDLNLSGTLAALSTTRIDFGLLGRDVCQIGFDSSFTPLGRGALPESSSAPLRLRGN